MQESSTYQAILLQGQEKGLIEGRNEGRADGVHLSLLTILEQKFGRVPGELFQQIRSIDDVARLQNAIRHALTIANIDELKL